MKKTKTINSLYIHIPFCRDICPYCDFPKLYKIPSFISPYLDSLILELENLKINHKLKTVYIGGGTPSCINLTPLFIKLEKYIDINTEFSVECNVLDINTDLLKKYKKYGVNRISIGLQALNDNVLKALGRKHTSSQAIKNIKLAKKYISNINIDLIYGFKELTNDILSKELKKYIRLDVKHISTYCLEIHTGTIFYNEKRETLDSAIIRQQFDLIYSKLTNAGFNRYEISNFAKKGYESKHNITYWKDEEYYGIGLGAASYTNGTRYINNRNIKEYMLQKYHVEEEKITIEDNKKYYLMLNLRLKEGINLKKYQNRFKSDLLIEKKEAISKLIERQLLKKDYTNLRATYEGSMLLDIILRELF